MKDAANDMNFQREEEAKRIAYLIGGYLKQTLSEAEHDELDEWVGANDDNMRLFEELTDPQAIKKHFDTYKEPRLKRVYRQIEQNLKKTENPKGKKQETARILRYSIAATLLLLTGTLVFFWMNSKKDQQGTEVNTKQDLAAGGNKATLRLINGKTIDLSAAKNGLIDSSEGTDVLKTAEGQLSYENIHEAGKGSHILSTPAGGQYAVTLPDGTRVWLNASSSLKYPIAFAENERVVELQGEGYFEVNKIALSDSHGWPFIVKLREGTRVEVTGTHFNVNSYEDEESIETALLEGKVDLVSRGKGETRQNLKPGDLGKVAASGKISVVSNTDTSMAVAWKNGKFQFKDATIEEVMRQVCRWYDATVEYQAKPTYHFNATTIYRSEPLSKLLDVLAATEQVHFTVKGRNIIVTK
jgi:transmembrane sensor